MSKRIVIRVLIWTTAIVISIPISPAKAQIPGGFNPAGSVPGFGGLGLPDPGGGTDLGNLLGNSGGPLGNSSMGGLFGGINGGNLGNTSNLGGLLNGIGSGSSSGGDLVSLLQSYLQGFLKMAQNAIGEVVGGITGTGSPGSNTASAGMPKDPGLGETLSHVTTAMKTNTGGLGLPDFVKSREDAIAGAKNEQNSSAMIPFSGINLSTLQPGQIAFKTTFDFNNTVLGKEAQERHVKAMDAVLKSIAGVSQLSQASSQSAKKSAQASQQAIQAGQSVAQVAQKSTSTASTVVSLGSQAKAAISTQDVVKFQAQQTGELANIMAGVSTQLGGNSIQLSSVSSELSELSGQAAQQSGQLKEISAINGDQAVSLRSVQVGQAVANLNLSDINQGNQGDRQRRLLESQADTMLLTFSNGFRLSGQR